jgi:hypothetical protein
MLNGRRIKESKAENSSEELKQGKEFCLTLFYQSTYEQEKHFDGFTLFLAEGSVTTCFIEKRRSHC